MTTLAASAVDVVLLIAVALAVCEVLRRASASMRHAVLAAAIVAASAAPLLELLVPQWRIPIASTVTETASTSSLRLTSAPAPEPAPDPDRRQRTTRVIDWAGVLLAIWAAGVIVCCGRLAVDYARLARLRRKSTTLADGPCASALADLWVRLKADATWRRPPVLLVHRSNNVSVLTWGLITPRIIVPAAAAHWPPARCRAVLLHELEHIRRRDWAVQAFASVLCALHWFNPLVWWAANRLRDESELACDDAVLNCGVRPADYATDLLEIARLAVGARAPLAAALGIAHPSTLERRISIMLTDRRRQPLTSRARFATTFAALVTVAAIAAATVGEAAHQPTVAETRDIALVTLEPPMVAPPTDVTKRVPQARALRPAPAAQQPAGAMEGIVLDQTGAVLPGVTMTLQDTDFGVTYNATTGSDGMFRFRELSPARYQLRAALAGFSIVENVMQVTSGARIQRLITLPIGSLEESMTVTCNASAPGLPTGAPAAGAQRPEEVALLGSPVFRAANRSGPREFATRSNQSATPALSDDPAKLPVRVGGQIRVPRMVTKVAPVCPSIVFAEATTLVRLVGRIGIDGYLTDLRAAPSGSAAPPPLELVESTLAAVRQWVFTPTFLNNLPIEANITITTRYTR